MNIQKCKFCLFVVFLFATHVSWAQGIVGTGAKVVAKEAIAKTGAGAVWQRGFSGAVVPVASVTGPTVMQTVKAPQMPSPLRGDGIIPQVAKPLNLGRSTVVGLYGALNPKMSTEAIKRAVLQRMPSLPEVVPHPTVEYLKVNSFEGIDLSGHTGAFPAYPIPTSNVNVYRGMHLTAGGVKNILKNGLRLDANPNNAQKTATTTSKVQYISSFGTAPIPDYLLASADLADVTYTTVSTSEALHYAAEGTISEGEVPVVLKLNKKYRNPKHKVREHYLIKEDVPAEDIEEMLVLVKDPQGNPIWCRAQLSEGDEILLFPYAVTEESLPGMLMQERK